MTDIAPHLERLGLEQYLDIFLSEGFDTWETLADIQESDFDALSVKLGHRRLTLTKKLQRAIADYRGIPYERVLGSPAQEGPPESGKAAESAATPVASTERASGPAAETKRKYRRHPKPDDNAPERPPSAYVIFSNKIREEVKDQNLSFTQIAKLVGDRWQKLDPAGKEPFEAQANAAKERYNIQLSTYRKTDAYKDYMQYLAEFKSKQGQSAEPKRPKLEPESSDSIISAKSLELNPESTSQLSGHVRGGSMGSAASSSLTGGPTQSAREAAGLSRPPLPSSRSGSPPSLPHGRDYLRPGLLSTQSSVSDDSSGKRSDVPDSLMRTAALSLGTGSSSGPAPPPPTPSLLTPGAPAPLGEVLGTPDYVARTRMAYNADQQQQQQQQHQQHQQQSQLASATPPFGSAQASMSAPALPSFGMQDSSWRNRYSDPRVHQETPRAVHGSLPYNNPPSQHFNPSHRLPNLSPDRPPDYPQGSSMRTLPPPRPPSTGNPALGNLGSPALSEEASYFRRPAREEARPALDRSESDAASTLAGLAAGVSRPETTRPLSHPPPHSSPP
ncbi:hypothetical protein EDD37DRAFT_610165 [Exophiala viscosa]|uniref:uncharacterized protein n=1 Tax=Exophiala viscosa TaxID=2486360 RepID=UPI00218E967C|nr:hypothetical protein EDD37DRAFT_610165 [Exophiala viscosa]